MKSQFDTSAIGGDWQRIQTIDAHTAGEPLRIVTGGWPEPPGETILEKRRFARERQDHLRRFLMLEPRGHADMYGCLPTPPTTPDGHVGVLFMHNEGFSTMCGHGIIGLVKVGLELKLFERDSETDQIRIDTPAGRVVARAEFHAGSVEAVTFENVPSFVLEPALELNLAEWGRFSATVAFGGAFYAYVDACSLGLALEPSNVQELIRCGRAIKSEIQRSYPIRHPEAEADLNFLYGTIFVDTSGGVTRSRNVCIFAEGEVDRSPTGTGVSGRAAIHYLRGEIEMGQLITVESILGTSFQVSALRETRVGHLQAVIPKVKGSAHITGQHEFLLDPQDDLPYGFLMR